MREEIKTWSARAKNEKPTLYSKMTRLNYLGATPTFNFDRSNETGGLFFRVLNHFEAGQVKVNIFITLLDWQCTSDVVITNMTTLPARDRGKGYGGRAVQTMIRRAIICGFEEIRATQVNNPDSERFWIKNGFVKILKPNKTNDFVFVIKN